LDWYVWGILGGFPADGGSSHARYWDQRGNSIEASVMDMLDRMRGGRWKVFNGGANDGWLEEFRLLHRGQDGRIVCEGDDAISASRYALMMLSEGKTSERAPPRVFSLGGHRGGWMST
jgi:hypothetical protein